MVRVARPRILVHLEGRGQARRLVSDDALAYGWRMAKTKPKAAKAAPKKATGAAKAKATPAKPAKPAKVATPAKPAGPAKAAKPAKVEKPAKVAARRKGPAPIDSLGAADVLTRLVLFARSEEDLGDEVPRLIDRLAQTADATLIPAMFGALDDEDPHGVLWSIFYLLEGFDDDYLAGLIDALPDLLERAPGWAHTAVLRIVNTHGEPEDCTATFVALARRGRVPARKRIATVLARMGKTLDGLHPSQRKLLAGFATSIAS